MCGSLRVVCCLLFDVGHGLKFVVCWLFGVVCCLFFVV